MAIDANLFILDNKLLALKEVVAVAEAASKAEAVAEVASKAEAEVAAEVATKAEAVAEEATKVETKAVAEVDIKAALVVNSDQDLKMTIFATFSFKGLVNLEILAGKDRDPAEI